MNVLWSSPSAQLPQATAPVNEAGIPPSGGDSSPAAATAGVAPTPAATGTASATKRTPPRSEVNATRRRLGIATFLSATGSGFANGDAAAAASAASGFSIRSVRRHVAAFKANGSAALFRKDRSTKATGCLPMLARLVAADGEYVYVKVHARAWDEKNKAALATMEYSAFWNDECDNADCVHSGSDTNDPEPDVLMCTTCNVVAHPGCLAGSDPTFQDWYCCMCLHQHGVAVSREEAQALRSCSSCRQVGHDVRQCRNPCPLCDSTDHKRSFHADMKRKMAQTAYSVEAQVCAALNVPGVDTLTESDLAETMVFACGVCGSLVPDPVCVGGRNRRVKCTSCNRLTSPIAWWDPSVERLHIQHVTKRPCVVAWHDESTCHSGDRQRSAWMSQRGGDLRAKSLGSAIMISGFMVGVGVDDSPGV